LNLILTVSFVLDLVLSMAIPAGFKSAECGTGIKWMGHYIMAGYLVCSFFLEYLLVQRLYSAIGQPCDFARVFMPLLTGLFGLLAKLDLYSDINMVAEIFKCSAQFRDYKLLALFAVSVATFVVSVVFQLLSFARMCACRQPTSTYNPLYSNTANLAYCASLKSVGSFCDKFSVNYYGFMGTDKFSAVKAIAFNKLVFEDLLQCSIQVLFYVNREDIMGTASNFQMVFTILFSISLSGLSALSSIGILITDVTSPLSVEDYKTLDKEYRSSLDDHSSNLPNSILIEFNGQEIGNAIGGVAEGLNH